MRVLKATAGLDMIGGMAHVQTLTLLALQVRGQELHEGTYLNEAC
jgi:hypothetical protein